MLIDLSFSWLGKISSFRPSFPMEGIGWDLVCLPWRNLLPSRVLHVDVLYVVNDVLR